MSDLADAERAVLEVADGKVTEISSALVATWMRSASLEVQGVAFAVLVSPHLLPRVSNGISQDEWFAFSKSFLARCLLEDVGGDWALTGYEAARHLASAYELNPGPANAERRAALREALEEAILKGDESLTKRVCQGAVEHLLSSPWIKSEFSGWKSNPALARVYSDALGYSANG
ncbi:hypothetical protein [Pseudoxanthomonas sp. LARHCG66]|jgi:hypothetical protein